MKTLFSWKHFPFWQQQTQTKPHAHKHETSWEPAIAGFGAASHDHSAHISGNSKTLLSRIADKIKSVDGIDETASLTGQILPGIAGAIATATILGAATPFVWLGVLGMKEEYDTACEEFNEILHRQTDVETKIKEMTFFAQSKRHILKEKFGLDVAEDSDANLQNTGSMLGLAHYTAEYHTLENKKIIAALGKKFGWTGLIGMAGMFAGMLPATTAAGIGIASEISASVALESAAVALELASGSCFLAGQAAMTVYAVNRGYQGVKAKAILQKSKQIFEEHGSVLSATTFSHVNEIIDSQIRFIEKHSIEYAKLTVAGQAAMIAGTITGMTGFGVVVTIPLFGVGAPLTIGGALQRIYYQGKEKKFKGKNSAFTDERIAEVSPVFLFTRFFEEAVSETDIAGYSDTNILKTLDKKVLAALDRKFDEVTTQLAAVKCYSILHHVVNSQKTPEQKIKYVEEHSDYLLRGLKNTGLEKAVLQKMRAFYLKERDNFATIMASLDANNIIAQKVIEVLGTLPEELGLDEDFFVHPIDKQCSRKLIAAAKSSLKSARFFTADSIVRVTQTLEARHILGLEEEGKNFNENYTAEYLFGSDSPTTSCGDASCRTIHNPLKTVPGNKAQRYASTCALVPVTRVCNDALCSTIHNPLEMTAGDNAPLYASTCAQPFPKKRKKKQTPTIKIPDDSPAQPEALSPRKENIKPLENTEVISIKAMEVHPVSAKRYETITPRPVTDTTPHTPSRKIARLTPKESTSTTLHSQLISEKEAIAIAKALVEKQPLPKEYVEFAEISRATLKDGSVHVIYQDPFDKNSDKHIHYLIDNRGRLTVQHGCAASALIPVNMQSGDTVTGVEIHTICNGRYEGGPSKQAAAHYGKGESLLKAVLSLQKTANISHDFPHWQKHVKTSQTQHKGQQPGVINIR